VNAAGKPIPGPQAAFAARTPKPVAAFDMQAWCRRQGKGWCDMPRIPLPGGRFITGTRMGFLAQDSADALWKYAGSPRYLESISPEAADKIICYAFTRNCRVEIRDTAVRIRYGQRYFWEGKPDTARATLTRKEKERLDSAMVDMPGGMFATGYPVDCDGMDFYMSVYGIKRISFGSCLQFAMLPDDPLEVLVPILRTMCRRQGIPDVTDPHGDSEKKAADREALEKELKALDVP
jgi:hypothetical protein